MQQAVSAFFKSSPRLRERPAPEIQGGDRIVTATDDSGQLWYFKANGEGDEQLRRFLGTMGLTFGGAFLGGAIGSLAGGRYGGAIGAAVGGTTGLISGLTLL